MKNTVFVLALLVSVAAAAQSPALQLMAGTERAFAARSVANGTRDAFLAFMDSSAIIFNKDSFTRGYPVWQAKEARPGVLDWKPAVAEIAGSGDWGFTSGPWTFRKSPGEAVVATGHFFTIWRRNADKQWKFIFDCGIDGGKEPLEMLYPFLASKSAGDSVSLLQTDSLYMERMRSDAKGTHAAFLSSTSVVCRKDGIMALTPGLQMKWTNALPANIGFTRAGCLIASSRDMALVYGTVFTAKEGRQPFVRLWRHEAGGWRIAAELLPI